MHGAAENEATAREVTLTELRERTAAVAERDTLAPASPEGAGLARLAERFGRRRLGRE